MSDASISREDVRRAYLELLGREPESDDTIAAYLALPHRDDVRRVILESKEYRDRQQPQGAAAEVGAAAASAGGGASPRHTWADLSQTPFVGAPGGLVRVMLLGNCQVVGVAQLMNAMSSQVHAQAVELTHARLATLESDATLHDQLQQADGVWVQGHARVEQWLVHSAPTLKNRVRRFPAIDFLGFHPDCVYLERSVAGQTPATASAGPLFAQGPLGDYHSALAFWAWSHGWSAERALGLFCPEVFAHLGYTGPSAYWVHGIRSLVLRGQAQGFPMAQWISRWERQGVWMHSVNHPKLAVLADLARHCLAGLVSAPMMPHAEAVVPDHLARSPCWPLYPGVGSHLGWEGSYAFKKGVGQCDPARPVQFLDLPQMLAQSFAAYDQHGAGRLACARLQTPEFQTLGPVAEGLPRPVTVPVGALLTPLPEEASKPPVPAEPGRSPYADLPAAHFWRRVVAQVPGTEVDPVVSTRFKVHRTDRVATAGSCFAQHIARTLAASGFLHWVVEPGEGLSPEQREQGHYGVYSARYGNVYSARQLLQLTELAYGQRQAADLAWQRPDGRWVDPLRPAIEPLGWASPVEMLSARAQLLQAVRAMLEGCQVFVFTLGLTEVWRRQADGLVLPLPPGAVTPWVDPSDYGFVNFTQEEVHDDLAAFLRWLHALNPAVRVILTVSPVPLIATYELQGVLQANTYSKSALRVAAQRLHDELPWVDYFPSYEIITGQFHRGAYYEHDLRSVKQEGVDHVMRVFMRHYGASGSHVTPLHDQASEWQTRVQEVSHIICEEEALDPNPSLRATKA